MKNLYREYLKKHLPPLYSQERNPDPLVHAKFFTPWSYWTWYAIEFDGEDVLFGWVEGQDKELGYFSLSELEQVRGPCGLEIEQDLYFRPVPLSQIRD